MSENTPQEDTRMSLADLAKLKAEAPAAPAAPAVEAAPTAEAAPAAPVAQAEPVQYWTSKLVMP